MIKNIYNILPKSLKESSKEIYYNLFTQEKFSRTKDIYNTLFKNGITLHSKKPMYFIVNDIHKYEEFYTIKEGDVVIDAGANEGYLSIYYSKKVKENGAVFAFEPDSINILEMNNNIQLNAKTNNISIFKDLLWNINTELDFFEAGNVASSVHIKVDGAKKVKRNAITLNTFAKNENLKRLDFIKMDIEGAEIEALDGCVDVIKKYKPNFAIASYHIVNEEYTYKKVEEFFSEVSYPFKTVFYKDGEIITFAGENL
ncbi:MULTISPECIES: FkbM family methyltransferase [Tenacibaculum]|uniref:FkbM family methyltransferase n=1 Tax=Tenacibaculum TaxID=104267 RepID=UPI001F0AE6CA|nr:MULTISPECIES: FkbM family methyltransferase [Tenacibaculum]MCH3881951.1 FkbM family methyltransferase [Tenacibaculum aquimarinum]MDO6600704.1 FkbM family methyltransferase [Tenacibaculum sp. 1_MG-2023]